MPLFIAALLGLGGLAIVIYPLLGQHAAREEAGSPAPVAEVADRERLARAALREVEFDHSLGNLDDGDYAALRERYERRALSALKVRYQREQELDARIEQELAALRVYASSTLGEPASAEHQSIESAPAKRSTRAASQAAQVSRTSQASPASQGPRARRRKGL